MFSVFIYENRLSTKVFWQSKSKASNASKEGRVINRRVGLKQQKKNRNLPYNLKSSEFTTFFISFARLIKSKK